MLIFSNQLLFQSIVYDEVLIGCHSCEFPCTCANHKSIIEREKKYGNNIDFEKIILKMSFYASKTDRHCSRCVAD